MIALPDQFLVGERAIDVGGIEQRDAERRAQRWIVAIDSTSSRAP